MSDFSDPSFWEGRYLSGQMGWEKGRCAPPIARMLSLAPPAGRGAGERGSSGPLLPQGAQVVVLGAGLGHEALEVAARGYQATALDFAASSIAAIQAAAAERKLNVQTLHQDLFTLGRTHPATFDAALEHTCYCAIDPARRDEYVQAVSATLKPGGLLFGLFYAHGRPGGPPFDSTEEELRARFGPHFEVQRLVRAPDSFPERANEELEFIFRKR